MSPLTLMLFRAVHILVGVTWVGAIVFMAVFLMPTLDALGPARGPVLRELTVVRRLPVFLMAGMLLTLLSGIGLYWFDSAGFTSKVWLASGQARTLGLGAVFAILTGIVGMTVSAPSAKKLGGLTGAVQAAGQPPTPEQAAEMNRLRGRLAGATKLSAVLLLLATLAMAIARYVPA
jgi:uncharacterized membrane protein